MFRVLLEPLSASNSPSTVGSGSYLEVAVEHLPSRCVMRLGCWNRVDAVPHWDPARYMKSLARFTRYRRSALEASLYRRSELEDKVRVGATSYSCL